MLDRQTGHVVLFFPELIGTSHVGQEDDGLALQGTEICCRPRCNVQNDLWAIFIHSPCTAIAKSPGRDLRALAHHPGSCDHEVMKPRAGPPAHTFVRRKAALLPALRLAGVPLADEIEEERALRAEDDLVTEKKDRPTAEDWVKNNDPEDLSS